jgi:hypothetical protein
MVPAGVDEGIVVEESYEMGGIQARGISDEMRSGWFKLMSRCGGVSLEYVL